MEQRTCRGCDAVLPPRVHGPGRPRLWCSPECCSVNKKPKVKRPSEVCVWCGQKFQCGKRGPVRKYCCDSHRVRHWQSLHPEEHEAQRRLQLEKQRHRRAAAPKSKLVLTCECGVVFERRGNTQKYCSRKCRSKANRSTPEQQAMTAARVERERERLLARDIVCTVCGDIFHSTTHKPPKYCDKTCEGYAKSLRMARPKPCERCGTTDGRANQAPRHCGPCKRWVRAERAAAKSLALPTNKAPWCAGSCVVCASPFVSTQPKALVCSDRCRRRRSGQSRRAKYGPETNRKRARLNGGFYELVNRRKVFERDGYRCGICGGQTDPTVKVPHHNAPTLDHIVPMALGGAHAYRNVQCAHFDCNWDKGDDLPTLTELIAA